jgi:hypothetical protein
MPSGIKCSAVVYESKNVSVENIGIFFRAEVYGKGEFSTLQP